MGMLIVRRRRAQERQGQPVNTTTSYSDLFKTTSPYSVPSNNANKATETNNKTPKKIVGNT